MTMATEKKPDEKSISNDFYMKISDSSGFRRNLLETSKETLNVLKEIHSVKQLRQKKQEKIGELHKELKELKLLVQKLEELMPEYNKSEVKKHFPEFFKEKHHDKRISFQESKIKKPISELDQLSAALTDIQKKLSSL